MSRARTAVLAAAGMAALLALCGTAGAQAPPFDPSVMAEWICYPARQALSTGVCGCAYPGACGERAPAGCYCDERCADEGDCCPDACPACGECTE